VITVTKRFTFEAAHVLPNHSGKCRHLHGHSYKLEVTVRYDEDPRRWNARGYFIDFGDLGKIVKEHVVDKLDHRDLNQLLDNPTAEALAFWIQKAVNIGLHADRYKHVRVESIRLWETEDCYVTLF
jgi:6-pyruvoyltetrahydropterin/6-carboxytetrahydropterin synthase